MKLTQLALVNFRNYLVQDFSFDTQITAFVGDNAVGKTNILEAIYLLALGDSFRANKIEEMINWDQEIGHLGANIEVLSSTQEIEKEELRITLTRGEFQGKRVAKRKFALNGVGKRKKDFVGQLQAVLFRPEDVRLLAGSPGSRRRFLDEVLTQADRSYAHSLSNYEKALKRRNKVLEAIREGRAKKASLYFWDETVLAEGEVIRAKRQAFIDQANEDNALKSEKLFSKLVMEYQPSLITKARMKEHIDREVIVGHTLIGPHKDDFTVKEFLQAKARDLAIYGSRGEQRMAVLWLKLQQLQQIEHATQQRPLLLLDDIFSELDDSHGALVKSFMTQQQTILTTTEVEDVAGLETANMVMLDS